MPEDFGPGVHDGIERGFEGGFHWFGVVPVLLFLVLIGVIVWAVIVLARQQRLQAATAGGPSGAMPVAPVATASTALQDPALEELRLRYARGEMTRQDYADRLADLSGAPARTSGDDDASAPAPPDGT